MGNAFGSCVRLRAPECVCCKRKAGTVRGGIPASERGQWRVVGSALVCAPCASEKRSARCAAKKAKFLNAVKELSFGRTVKEPCLKRIVSGKEWHRSSSFSEPYRATMSESTARRVTVAELRQELAAVQAVQRSLSDPTLTASEQLDAAAFCSAVDEGPAHCPAPPGLRAAVAERWPEAKPQTSCRRGSWGTARRRSHATIDIDDCSLFGRLTRPDAKLSGRSLDRDSACGWGMRPTQPPIQA